jgi:hypothetical protein
MTELVSTKFTLPTFDTTSRTTHVRCLHNAEVKFLIKENIYEITYVIYYWELVSYVYSRTSATVFGKHVQQ